MAASGLTTIIDPENFIDSNGGINKYATLVNTSSLDEDFEKIGSFRKYCVFIMAEGDNILSFSNTLSCDCDSVTLYDYTGMESDLQGKVNIYSYGNSVKILLDESISKEGRITLFNSLGQTIAIKDVEGSKMTIDNITENGVYLVTVRVGNALIRKKVFINK